MKGEEEAHARARRVEAERLSLALRGAFAVGFVVGVLVGLIAGGGP